MKRDEALSPQQTPYIFNRLDHLEDESHPMKEFWSLKTQYQFNQANRKWKIKKDAKDIHSQALENALLLF